MNRDKFIKAMSFLVGEYINTDGVFDTRDGSEQTVIEKQVYEVRRLRKSERVGHDNDVILEFADVGSGLTLPSKNIASITITDDAVVLFSKQGKLHVIKWGEVQ